MSNWQKYNAPNIGLLFYRQIYNEPAIRGRLTLEDNELYIKVSKEEKQSPFDTFYQDLYDTITTDFTITPAPSVSTLLLFTTYPGLLCGSGYSHDSKAKGDFKIGFSFDYTTGLPVIPGSSVKGTLRSAFEKDVNDKGDSYAGVQSVGFIKWMLEEIKENAIAESLSESLLNKIISQIFGDEKTPGADIFFDAVIDISETGNRKFLATDFITPHFENLLKNPTPIQFLKVLPNVAFRFSFKLMENADAVLSKQVKEKLFKFILITLGIGAKTNVGYGQFSEKGKSTPASSGSGKQQQAAQKNFWLNKETFKKGQEVKMKVKATGEELLFISERESEFSKSAESVYKKMQEIAEKKKRVYMELSPGMEITIRFNTDVTAVSDTANFTVLPVFV